MSGLNKGLSKVEVTLMWDPAPSGAEPHDLDLVAGTYRADDPHGEPAYLVHFDSRLSPDGTITLDRDSRTGQGFGPDEAMTLELERLSEEYGRVLVGVVIQQGGGRITFGDVANCGFQVSDAGTGDWLSGGAFTEVAGATAAVVAEFARDDSGAWLLGARVRGFDTDPASFAELMGA